MGGLATVINALLAVAAFSVPSLSGAILGFLAVLCGYPTVGLFLFVVGALTGSLWVYKVTRP